ncbi:MAG: energy transducer TonB [Acidobacteriia bacterium]|nr:energy transducer TonB [Terriglobia bacterium]
MRRWFAVAVLAVCCTGVLVPYPCSAQQDQPEAKRKVLNRVVPTYPELARTMNLRGVVRVEALVAANGTVKSLEARGGHPVLVQAAENAVRKWKWAPSTHETKEPIEVKFDPQ